MFDTQMIAALMLGMASGASAQPATNDHGPRADYSATMGVEHRACKLAYFDQIDSGQIDGDQIDSGQIDSGQIDSDRASYRDGVVTLVEMKAAGVIK